MFYNKIVHALGTITGRLLTKCGPHIWLCLNTIVTFSWLGVIEVTHQTAVTKVQSSILGSENDFYGGLFVLMIMIRVSGYRHIHF